MNQVKADYKYQELTERVIKAFYTIYNALGYGFLEKVYENALLIELAKNGIPAIAESPIHVFYDGNILQTSLWRVALLWRSRPQRT